MRRTVRPGIFGTEGVKIPTVLFWLGAIDPAKFAAAKAEGRMEPGMHTSRFAPLPEPTLKTGVTGMTAVAMAAPPRSPTATIWTTMPTTWRP